MDPIKDNHDANLGIDNGSAWNTELLRQKAVTAAAKASTDRFIASLAPQPTKTASPPPVEKPLRMMTDRESRWFGRGLLGLLVINVAIITLVALFIKPSFWQWVMTLGVLFWVSVLLLSYASNEKEWQSNRSLLFKGPWAVTGTLIFVSLSNLTNWHPFLQIGISVTTLPLMVGTYLYASDFFFRDQVHAWLHTIGKVLAWCAVAASIYTGIHHFFSWESRDEILATLGATASLGAGFAYATVDEFRRRINTVARYTAITVGAVIGILLIGLLLKHLRGE